MIKIGHMLNLLNFYLSFLLSHEMFRGDAGGVFGPNMLTPADNMEFFFICTYVAFCSRTIAGCIH